MSDLIDREALLAKIKIINSVQCDDLWARLKYLKYIMDAPTVEPKRGEWEDKILEKDHKPWIGRYECSECKMRVDQSWYYFCPNCGADMRGERND